MNGHDGLLSTAFPALTCSSYDIDELRAAERCYFGCRREADGPALCAQAVSGGCVHYQQAGHRAGVGLRGAALQQVRPAIPIAHRSRVPLHLYEVLQDYSAPVCGARHPREDHRGQRRVEAFPGVRHRERSILSGARAGAAGAEVRLRHFGHDMAGVRV